MPQDRWVLTVQRVRWVRRELPVQLVQLAQLVILAVLAQLVLLVELVLRAQLAQQGRHM